MGIWFLARIGITVFFLGSYLGILIRKEKLSDWANGVLFDAQKSLQEIYFLVPIAALIASLRLLFYALQSFGVTLIMLAGLAWAAILWFNGGAFTPTWFALLLANFGYWMTKLLYDKD